MTAAAAPQLKVRNKFPTLSLIVVLAAIAAVSALFYPPVRQRLDRIQYWTADWRTVLLADRTAGLHKSVIVVLFDPATFDGNVTSPIPRDTHALVLHALDAMHPSAIGLDFFFVASQGAEKDSAIMQALHDMKSPIVLGAVDAHTDEFSEQQTAYQAHFLQEAGRPAGYLALRYDPGHIVRRTSPPVAGSPFQESFARQVAIASKAKLESAGASSASMPIAWVVGPGYDTQPFLTVSARDLMPGASEARRTQLAEKVKDNVVLTGIAMPNYDRHDTALSVWTDDKMLGVLVHAHIIAQLLDGRYFTELRGKHLWSYLAVVGLIGLGLGWLVRGRRAAFLNLSAATVILVVVDAFFYLALRTVLPFMLSLYVWFAGVLAGQNLRLIARWAAARLRSPAMGEFSREG